MYAVRFFLSRPYGTEWKDIVEIFYEIKYIPEKGIGNVLAFEPGGWLAEEKNISSGNNIDTPGEREESPIREYSCPSQ